MTISKKLLIVWSLAAGMHYGAQANDYETKQLQVLEFVETLQNYYDEDMQKAAKWLDKQMTTSGYYSHDYRLLKIIKIIETNSSIHAKTVAILALKTKNKERVAKQQTMSDEIHKKYEAERQTQTQEAMAENEKHEALRRKQTYKDLAMVLTATIFIFPTMTCLGKIGEHAGTTLFNTYFSTRSI